MVADRQSSPDYRTIESLDEYLRLRPEQGLFFILFDSYHECPLQLTLVKKGYYAGQYFVGQRVGGPTIVFLASNERQKNGAWRISDGSLTYFPTYENTITGEMERTPEALAQQYKRIIKEAKKGSKTIKGESGRKYVIGSHTYQAIREGTLTLGVEGLDVPM